MMKNTTETAPTLPHGTLTSYVTGFTLSLLLTAVPFLMVYYHTLHGLDLVAAIVVFALLQLGIQLVYFLHLGRNSGSRWNNTAFAFMAIVVITIVIGSIWIMYNLNYNMTPAEINKQVQQTDDL